MRIAYLSKSELPSRSANSIQVVKTCESMARAGHDVLLVGVKTESPVDEVWTRYGVEHPFEVQRFARSFGPPDFFWEIVETALDGEGVWEHLIPRLRMLRSSGVVRKYCWKYAFSALIATRAWRADLIYGRDPWSISLARLLRKPLVFELHKAPPPRIERLASLLFRSDHFRRLVVISEALRSHCKQQFLELSPRNIVVAPDAASPSAMRPLNPRKNERLLVGYTGSLNPGKGADFLCELVQASPEFDFHVSGSGPSTVNLSQLASRRDNIEFHGQLTHQATRNLQASMDILLAPYTSGKDSLFQWMSPLKIFEYMSTGLPILASDLPALREVLVHEQTALLIPPENLVEWRCSHLRVQNDRRLAVKLGGNAQTLMLSLYTWEKRLDKVLDGLP